jgi:hypothetical protein
MKPGKDELTNYTTLYMSFGGYRRLKSSGPDLLSRLEISVMKAYRLPKMLFIECNLRR